MAKADDHQDLQTAVSLHQQGRLSEAADLYRRLIEKNADNFHALHFLGLIEAAAGNTEQAKLLLERSLAIQPPNIQFVENYASVLFQAGDFKSALEACQGGLRLHNNDVPLLYVNAVSLFKLSQYQESVAQFDRLLALAPNHVAALNERGSALAELQQYDAALASVEKALLVDPRYAEAHVHKGNLFAVAGRLGEALAAYDTALALVPNLAEAWLGRSNVFFALGRFDEAAAAYDKALAHKHAFPGAEGFRLVAKLQLCDWSGFEAACGHLVSSIRHGDPVTAPFEFLAVPSSSEDQLRCAKLWNAKRHPPSGVSAWRGERRGECRILVAYLSADFRQHALGMSVVEFIERHDRSRFETIGLSIGPDDGSDLRARFTKAFERFYDLRGKTDDEVAALMREIGVDVAVEFATHTDGSRPGILARRPAPVQVSGLAAWTSGADHFDYVLADPRALPLSEQPYFTERIVHLPDSFFPHDSTREISPQTGSRADMELPEDAFVFCCFNRSYKLNPQVFGVWMNILRRRDGAVLWLSPTMERTAANLRREAVARGVDPARLIFAAKMPQLSDHLARYRLADLFLDTLPYGAHTTAVDALWAGLPVLTCRGNTFVGRVSASQLHAIGLGDLVTDNLAEYEAAALRLAGDPQALQALRDRLAENRLTHPLFDTERLCRHTEAAYLEMLERNWRSEPPAPFAVKAID